MGQSQANADTLYRDELEENYQDEPDYHTTTGSFYFLPKWKQQDSLVLQQRHLPAKEIKELQDDDAFWYANTDIKKKKPVPEKTGNQYVPLGQRTWFQTLLWLVIIGGFAAALMWFLAGSQVGLFRKRAGIVSQPEGEDEITGDIFAINYQKEIDKAVQAGNYRLAVRLMFLRLLKNMSERNIIQYQQDKTNLDYLIQLKPTSYYQQFFSITRNYEYAWYGLFEINEKAYQQISNDVNQFERNLG